MRGKNIATRPISGKTKLAVYAGGLTGKRRLGHSNVPVAVLDYHKDRKSLQLQERSHVPMKERESKVRFPTAENLDEIRRAASTTVPPQSVNLFLVTAALAAARKILRQS